MVYANNGFFAAIGIKYPIGDTCTCSDGVLKYTAPDTSGWWLFRVPHKGTWTAQIIINGNYVDNEVVSESVSVSNGDVAEITLTPWDGQLYWYGNQYATLMTTSGAVTLTGGWTRVGTDGTVSFDKNPLAIYMGSAGNVEGWDSWVSLGDVGTSAAIDMSNYTTLNTTIEYGSLMSTMSIRETLGGTSKKSVSIDHTSKGISAIDISSGLEAGKKYVVEFVAGYHYPTSASYYITEVYMSGKNGTVNVSYPLGSVCSLTNGTKTLTANSNFDSCSFTRLTPGTWTVKITNGENTASKVITVSKTTPVNIALDYS